MGNSTEHLVQENAQPQDVNGEQIAAMRDEMLRFAVLQLRDAAQAEDAVHEAIIAALVPGKYAGRGNLKSWVFSILRNKIIDVIRQRSRHPTETYLEEDSSALDEQFRKDVKNSVLGHAGCSCLVKLHLFCCGAW